MTRLLARVVAASVLTLATVTDATAATAAPIGASIVQGGTEEPTGEVTEEPAPETGPVGSAEEIDESVPADVDVEDVTDDGIEGPSVAVVGAGGSNDRDGTSSLRPGAIVTVAELVHISHSAGPRAASAHGCWRKLTGSGTNAKITVWLQMYKNGAWTTVDKEIGTKRHGCGGGKRVTARFECKGMVAWRDYRSIVDVDVIGVIDGPEKATSSTQRIYCYG